MRLTSVREPAFSPGMRFKSVVWRSVQFSPLKLQFPVGEYAVYQPGTRVYSESSGVWDRTFLQVTVEAGLVSRFLSLRNRKTGGGGGCDEDETYAMTETRGPSETKSWPVERTVSPWTSMGCFGCQCEALEPRLLSSDPQSQNRNYRELQMSAGLVGRR